MLAKYQMYFLFCLCIYCTPDFFLFAFFSIFFVVNFFTFVYLAANNNSGKNKFIKPIFTATTKAITTKNEAYYDKKKVKKL